MINYWSFTNNVNDSIGTAHLYNGVNASLTHDRFGNNNSALRLGLGYYCVPPGVYFNGPFTTSVWVNAKSKTNWARVFDFSVSGAISHNIIFAIFTEATSVPVFQVYFVNSSATTLSSKTNLVLNEWIHLAVTFDGSMANFFYNGVFTGNHTLYQPSNLTRSTNYIGKSNWAQNALANAVYDELRIYNRVLDPSEILSLMYF